MAESKRRRQITGGKYNNFKRPMANYTSSKVMINSQSTHSKLKIPLSNLNSGGDNDNKTPIKKKNSMNIKKTSNNNGFSSEIDFSKQRKNSLLIGGTKDD